jgi:hypothetical protein
MSEHTITIAVTVEADSAIKAHDQVAAALRGSDTIDPARNLNGITSWWVAEDQRIDGSDNDSAVFVHPGAQRQAVQVLAALGLTDGCNLTQGVDRPAVCYWERADVTDAVRALMAAVVLLDTSRGDDEVGPLLTDLVRALI